MFAVHGIPKILKSENGELRTLGITAEFSTLLSRMSRKCRQARKTHDDHDQKRARQILELNVLHTQKSHNLSTSCARNKLVTSLSTSCSNAAILSSCTKFVTHNLLTSC